MYDLKCYVLIGLTVILISDQTNADCSTYSGPAGITECVLLNPNYNRHQWAICLSDAYIMRKSKGKHGCVNRLATYCWYQCMLEEYESEGPGVYGVCLCNGTLSTNPTPHPGTALPAECFSPDGSSCSWYTDCLERKYPCQGTGAGYAIKYATKFCNLYNDRYGSFSSVGQRWVDAVRRCLQVSLVPLLRPYESATCPQIKDRAFRSHTDCYLTPYQGAPSVCELEYSDYPEIFFTVWESFFDPGSAAESVCGVFDVMQGCDRQWKSTRPCLRAVTVVVRQIGKSIINGYVTAVAIVNKIANLLNWDSVTLKRVSCASSATPDDDKLSINILFGLSDFANCLKSIAPTRKKRQIVPQMSTTTVTAQNSNKLDVLISDLKKAVRDGKLVVEVDGERIYVTGIGECDSFVCGNSTKITTFAPSGTPSKSTKFFHWFPVSAVISFYYVYYSN